MVVTTCSTVVVAIVVAAGITSVGPTQRIIVAKIRPTDGKAQGCQTTGIGSFLLVSIGVGLFSRGTFSVGTFSPVSRQPTCQIKRSKGRKEGEHTTD